jgi:uncharacterized GH25 family protein
MKNIFGLALILVLLNGCTKQQPSFPFSIKVVSEDGTPLPNVFVEATADVPNALPQFSGLTNEDGMVSFEYKYEAVLKIRATRGTNPPSWMGCNFIKLEADQTVISKVVLVPFDPTQPGC